MTAAVSDALGDTRVVLVTGARQAGKSTLVAGLAGHAGTEWRNLDRTPIRQAALADPDGFVDTDGPLVIDEVQRVPELLLSIKALVDEDPRPGRFLLTGSARLLGMRAVPDLLPGRTEAVELWPFSHGEIDGRPDGFIDAIFAHGPELAHTSTSGRRDYAARLTRGGFPEAVAREGRRRERFFDSYVADLITRDVMQLSEIEKTHEIRTLLRLLAGRSGQLLNANALAGEVGLSAKTVQRYLALLEEVFLIKRVPARSRNLGNRAVHAPKVAFVDSGVAANLLGADERSLIRPGSPVGPLMEGFVVMELARQLGWSAERAELFHYRTKDKVEVDAVLENRQGQVVGIEVKAGATVRAEDFRGLRHLAERLGDAFVAGLVLYAGGRTLSFDPKFRAMPISALWEVGER